MKLTDPGKMNDSIGPRLINLEKVQTGVLVTLEHHNKWIGSISRKVDKQDSKLNWILIVIIILAFFSGINAIPMLVKTLGGGTP